MAIDTAVKSDFPILRRIAKNAVEHGVEHRVVFGFSYQSAGSLVEFLKLHRHDLRQVTSVRYLENSATRFTWSMTRQSSCRWIIRSSRRAASRRSSSAIENSLTTSRRVSMSSGGRRCGTCARFRLIRVGIETDRR